MFSAETVAYKEETEYLNGDGADIGRLLDSFKKGNRHIF